ncbi:PVV-CTERM domain-containing choice-of-anchor G protein [Gryllotalpicola ginsengisoli]|uniref:PVV-CTERM domain-containing choice-of-anchor G protein n=1 Tax=Gryllotalpicola ginsengisoli TaxID=444608 RepID=UPI0003B583A1|nr:choice-of-anchor G family protein [Gryllotalpicola ginsengisoli]
MSQANGRLVTTSLLSSSVLDSLVALKGATAVDSDGSGDVTSDTPLDASAIAGLVGLQAGTTNLFGDNGIIQLGAVGQYAQANDDGSSSAFSGAVSQAPSLIGVSTVTPSNVGAPTADSTAEIALGSSTDPVSLNVTLGALAASAQETAAGDQSGQYTLANAGITVGGSVLSPVLASLNTPLQTLLGVASGLGVNVADPINSDGTVTLTLQDLLDAAGVTSINDLPPGTNLLTYVPAAVVTAVTNAVNGVLNTLQNAVGGLGLGGAVLSAAIATAQAVVNPILSGLTDTLEGPLGAAITALAQLAVNVQTHNSDGSFTETALRVGVGPNGSLASVDLASATVGPNAGPVAVPLINPSSAGIAGGVALLGGGAWFLAGLLRRRRLLATAA